LALIFRPLAPGELDTLLSLPGHQGSRHPFIDRDYQDVVAARHYRPEWSWVAERDGRLVARAAWWGFPGAAHPIALDWFDLGPDPDRVEVGAALLNAAREYVRTAAGDQADYHLFLPPLWRQNPELRPADRRRHRFHVAGEPPMRVMADDLLVRIAKDDYDRFIGDEGARPMVMAGKSSKRWILVPKSIVSQDAAMKKWLTAPWSLSAPCRQSNQSRTWR
jgi:hypothetical protein